MVVVGGLQRGLDDREVDRLMSSIPEMVLENNLVDFSPFYEVKSLLFAPLMF